MRSALKCFFVCTALLVLPYLAWSCSCNWGGPFLVVAKDSPMIIHGKILRHHSGRSPTMDVRVIETLKSGLLDSGMSIQMGDGMHCRPTLEQFPPGTEWILALNGPGSKPGKGWALSHCGEYWLRVEKNEVVGSIDGARAQVKRMALGEFRKKLLYPRFATTFSGRIVGGKRFSRPFGSRFEFILEPMPAGWEILVKELGSDENLARLTPPLHFVPNPRFIEGWHLSENPAECASREYGADVGPANPREFVFSPEVGKSIDGPTASRSVEPQDIERVRQFGHGKLWIKDRALLPAEDGCPQIEWMEFSVQLEGGY